MMNYDPRIAFADKLTELGVDHSTATLIALEAGGSQAVVNRLYLEELGINGNLQDQVFEEVVKFYMGGFPEDPDIEL